MGDKKRSACSISRIRKLKKTICPEMVDVYDNETHRDTKNKSKKLVVSSQPILKNYLKRKVHFLLDNWKPPLKKTVTNENQNIISQTNSQNCNEIEDGKNISKKEDCSSINLQKVTQDNSGDKCLQKYEYNNKTTDCGNCPKSDSNVETTYENIKIVGNETIILNETSMHQFSSTSDDNSNQTFDLKTKKPEESILGLENVELNSKVQGKPQNPKSDVQILETNNVMLIVTSTGLPSAPSIQKINMPTRDTNSDELSSDKIENTQCSKGSRIVNEESKLSNDQKQHCDQPKVQQDVKIMTNSSHDIVEKSCNTPRAIKQKEACAEIQDSTTKAMNFDKVLEDDLNISHSQLNLTENNIIPSPLTESRSTPNTFSHFIPFSSTSFAPTMPQMNWVHQMQEDRKRLQAVVREISQLNAMLTRAIREVWHEKKQP